MTFGEIPFQYTPGATYDQYMETAKAYADRMRRRAAEVISPGQLAVYDQMMAEKMVIVAAMIRSIVVQQSPTSN